MAYYNATDELIRRVFSQNLPWDQLYTNQKYVIYPNINDGGDFTEQGFFRQTSSVKPEEHLGSQTVDLTGNPNAAGIFSTPRFLTRFWNSSTNQNRKRTAAIFRIGLCDPMMPSIERRGEADVEKNLALGLSPEQFKMIHSATGRVNQHLTDPACVRCHQKIEPMAYTLRGLEGGVSQTGIPGSLRYFISQDNLTDIHVNNFSSLVSEMTKQPRYRYCQVNRFIQWIIGDDVPLSDERRQQFEEKFDTLGRKPNDFIAYLLLTPEFRSGKEDLAETQLNMLSGHETQMLIKANAQKTFSKCNVCHGGGIPSEVSINQITQALDLEHDGANRKMPPPQSSWQPTADDLHTVKLYIKSLTGQP